MAVTRPYLTQALTNWQQRAAQYQSLGIPQEKWYQIATQDIQNVVNNGTQPMSSTQVNAAMASQLAGRSLIGNPTPHPSGFFGDIGEAITSVPHDIQGLLSGLLGGTAHLVAHLPSELGGAYELFAHQNDPQWLSDHGYEPMSGDLGSQLAESFRDLSKSPIFSLFPGVADIADLTTGGGRQYLLQHPVTSALDVAPFAGDLLGRATSAITKPGEEGSALQALQQGRTVRAGVRATRATGDILTGGRISSAAGKAFGVATAHRTAEEIWASAANTHGVGDQARAMLRDHTITGRQGTRQLKDFLDALGTDVTHMSLDEAEALYQTTLPDGPIPTPEQQIFLDRMRDINDKLLIKPGQDRYRTTGGKDGLFVKPQGRGRLILSARDPLIKTIKRLDRDSVHIQAARRDIEQGKNMIEMHERKIRELGERIKSDSANGMPVERLIREAQREAEALEKSKTRLTTAQGHLKLWQKRAYINRRLKADSLYESGGTAAMHPATTKGIRAGLGAHRQVLYDTEAKMLDDQRAGGHLTQQDYEYSKQEALKQLNSALSTLNNASDFSTLKHVIEDGAERLGRRGEGEGSITDPKQYAEQMYNQIRKDVVLNVLNLVSHGYDPLWLKHIDPGREDLSMRILPNPDHIRDASSYQQRTFNFAPFVHDIGLGLVAGARDVIQAQATEAFVKLHVGAWGRTTADLEQEYHKLAGIDQAEKGKRYRSPTGSSVRSRMMLPTHTIAGHAQMLKDAEWEVIKPATYGLQSFAGVGRFSAQDEVNIPKWLATNLRHLTPTDKRTGLERMPLYGAYDKALHVFRFSVLTGPRHLVHVGVAGLLPLMMEEPGALLPHRLINSFRLVHAYNLGDMEKIGELKGRAFSQSHPSARVVDMLDQSVKHIYSFTDAIASYSIGRQHGTMLSKFWEATGQKVRDKLGRLEETVSDMYRVSAMLSADARGLTRDRAIAIGNKVAVDMDDMAPFERTIVKQIFPFYGFTRFLFRYLLNYPVDHPYRVSILSRFSTQEQEDWNTQIPQKLMMTLFLGHPDQYGNIRTINYNNLNPFRSFSNDFTMVGFFQSLNPIPAAILQARGFNILTAAGPLYPSLEFNPNTGTLQAAPPSGRDALFGALQQFVPELGALDHFVDITGQMKVLKRTNPSEYKALLYSQLNLPGILSPPISLNLPYVEEKAEMDRYQAASAAVSTGEKGEVPNAWSQAEQYQLVPFQGQYIEPSQLAAYWRYLQGQTPNINPKALITTPERKTSPDPLELLSGLSQLPASQSTQGY